MYYDTILHHADCPYCGESLELVIDPSEPEQTYIEDCAVCCRPIVVTVFAGEEEITVYLRGEDDA
jgi:hypothetical protein